MKIVVTGGQGQLGSDCQKVMAPNHEVHPFDSSQLNITDQGQVGEILQSIRPDVIINCAAYTAVDNCESDKEQCMLVNSSGPAILAREAERLQAKLIHISTDYVFDGNKPIPEPYLENNQVAPLSIYGTSKLAGENLIRAETENHLIIRTAWLYGLEGGNFLKTMFRLASQHPEKTLKVVNDQFGSLTWTHRLALQIERLLDTQLTGVIHATAEGSSSWYEGARLFLDALGIPFSMIPCDTAEYPTPARRPRNSILENSILKEKGLNVMKPWDEDVREFARIFRDSPGT